MKKIFYLYLVLLIMISCQRKNEVSGNLPVIDLPVIDLDAQTENAPTVKEVHYIPLETNDSSLIGNIHKIIFRNNHFYIFDRSRMNVLVFDRQGSFKNSIARVGMGPGEYVLATDMDVDELGNIYIGDASAQRVIKYKAENYEDYGTVNVNGHFIEFAISEDQSMYIGDSFHKGKLEFKLAKLNADGELDAILKNEIEETFLISKYSMHYFFRTGNALRYYERFSPVIYAISNTAVVSLYELRSNDFPSVEVAKEWAKDRDKIRTDKDSYIRDISAFYEVGDYISLTVRRKMGSYALYNKKTKKTYNWGMMNRPTPIGISGACASDGEYFVSYCTPTEYVVGEILAHNPNMDPETKERISKLTEESNPMMILYKY